MKTENQIRERIDGLEGYIARLRYFVNDALTASENSSCYVREIERAYKEIHALVWVIE